MRYSSLCLLGMLFTTLQIQLLLVATTISCHHKIICLVLCIIFTNCIKAPRNVGN